MADQAVNFRKVVSTFKALWLVSQLKREGRKLPSESDIAAELGVTDPEVAVLREACRTGYQNGGFRVYDISTPAKVIRHRFFRRP